MLYNQSKFANVVVACEVARRYGDQGIVSMSCHPGYLKTDLQREFNPVAHKFANLVLHPAPLGALTQLWGGTMPETLAYNGKFLIPWARVGAGERKVDLADIYIFVHEFRTSHGEHPTWADLMKSWLRLDVMLQNNIQSMGTCNARLICL
ncbi:hypothetical protein A0H81_06417 [Grifola frondosa]|uniref:Short-chain dehydrogenase TIC 32, chloroplastic n=1 Tax=Grifola frondosa TaxID=5627 RepID=A0A1C7M9G6_GRIFR|nr:hypothetical protein A0H81_06417 [Grifola frondosa]